MPTKEQLEKENQQLRADCAVMRDALNILSKWQSNEAVSGSGGYEQGLLCGLEDRGFQKDGYAAMRFGYDIALERVSEEIDQVIVDALSKPNPGAQLIKELERLQNLKIEVDNIEADGRPHGSDWQHNPCECDHCALWDRIKIASTASDKPKDSK